MPWETWSRQPAFWLVILLLLMAGDSQDDRNSALLTLALYLFL